MRASRRAGFTSHLEPPCFGFQVHLRHVPVAANDFRFMDIGTSGTRLFDIRGDGLTTVSSGGMAVLSGGATVTGGLTVRPARSRCQHHHHNHVSIMSMVVAVKKYVGLWSLSSYNHFHHAGGCIWYGG